MLYFPAEYFLQVYSLPLISEVRFQNDYFSEYPEQIRVGSDFTAVSYTRKSGYYAIHYNQPKTVAPGAILQLNDGVTGYAYAVFSGEPNPSEPNTLTPIYTVQPNGSLAVPTGLVFIRFAEGVDAESQRELINRAGYEITQSLNYAPHTAWLRARSGNIADAIAGIPQLEAIPKVENIEPQMLMERGLRQGR
ncbi:hypothetical protein CDG77_23105 [Nostoc sp. 'Peltigera membranacea cyanobiont' 213]|uniref:hypothetical protein n=1 Tax=Nostoc sp. 'Peltigera membranacea cyanobiont' 213 TaxID=2014530 RepID=UPI000B95BE31|nr:hypothetical protein [Nostoc sp. 'Peltigera membranacea cyanobiont' 213]OYD88550.1 hypothetical protein CDG77_23105 [Nostoc sp. 'Peltigera membranacea cyanobiont' 213]